MRIPTLLKFSKKKRIFHYASEFSYQNIESHNFDIKNYQTETVKKQKNDFLLNQSDFRPYSTTIVILSE